MIALESQLETTLYKYRKIQNRTLLKETVKPEEMAGNMPLNLFLFSLNSFCSTLLSFQQSHNSKIYNDVHRCAQVRWFHFRVTQNRVKLNSADIRDESLESLDNTSADCHEKWQLSCNHFQALVQDSFETMEMVFSDSFQYSDPDEMAVFMQMKEAFRLADKDCSGELNADDVATMLETIFAQSGAVKKEEIGLYVQQFMAVVGKPDRDTVSFEEFMSALEHGLTLEVEVYRRRKPRAPALVAHTLQAKEEVQSGDTKELETSMFSTCPSENASMLLRREYDILNVEDFSISDVVVNMKSAYVEWLMADKRYERVSMEEQLLLNCLVSSAESIAKSLAGLEEIAMSS
ncbi:hypothetical protein JM18_005140 [Phytophthora kernoviae]|uniref:EF-hand domain-containing protein n=2 Tax=Phytophthora kernoviae TaxID=325452 RepID=A0A921V7Q2_9STRA|nr:hypothetical protein G195_005583 [Phytophthora kernoviae 00238/432]KAG2524186.1 hypothetical protein JM18_005140 [Phytophthora kernoviae]